jgi:HK97 family phage portal protein
VGVFVRDRAGNPAAERRQLTFISPPVGPYTQALQDQSAGDPEGAMRTSAVWFCATKIAYSMAMMRPQTYRGPGPGDQGAVAVKTPVPPILQQPSSTQKTFGWTFSQWISLQLRGNAWGLILDRDKLGYPTQIELKHPDTVRFRRDSNGVPEIRINNELVKNTADVWHSAIHVMPGADLGMSTIKYAATATRTAQAAEAFGLSYFQDGAHPSAILTNKNANKISQPQAQAVKEAFVAALHGTREPVVMGGGWDYAAIQINPEDSQFLELMDAKGADIARFFGMMPSMAGYGTPNSSITYQNVEQSTMDFLTYPMTPFIIQQEEWETDLVPRGQYVKLDTSPLLRTDFLTRMTGYHMMIGSRAFAQSEVRAMEDYPPFTPEQKAEVDALVTPLPPPVLPVRQGE